MMKKLILFCLLVASAILKAQNTNTANNSGNWESCSTWLNPMWLYNSDQDYKVILSGKTVSVSPSKQYFAKRITLEGNGKIAFGTASGSNGKISFSGAGMPFYCSTTNIDNITIDFSESVSAKSLSGFLHSMNVNDDAKISPLSPKLMRIGNMNYYDRAYALSQRIHYVISDAWLYNATYHDSTQPCDAAYSMPPQSGTYQTFLNDLFVNYGKTASGAQKPGIVWECWNEPDIYIFWPVPACPYNDAHQNNWGDADNWPEEFRNQFFETYEKFYNTLQTALPGAIAAGPSLSKFNKSHMDAFFKYCLDHNIKVNVVTWHELAQDNTISTIKDHVAYIRDNYKNNPTYAALGIQSIEVNEIVGPEYKRNPAAIAAYLGNLEQARVDNAVKACWCELDDPETECWNPGGCDKSSINHLYVNSTAVNAGKKTAAYWAYKFYADGVPTRVRSYNEEGKSIVIANKTGSYGGKVLFGYTEATEYPDDIDSINDNGTYNITLKGLTGISPRYITIHKIPNPTDYTNQADPQDYLDAPIEVLSGSYAVLQGKIVLNFTAHQDDLYVLTMYPGGIAP